MASVLIVEDETALKRQYDEVLSKEGHQVRLVPGTRYSDIYTATVAILTRAECPFDFFILDIQFDDDKLGGVVLHRAILDQNLRRRFRHLLIVSKYYTGADSEISEALRSFMLSSYIPVDNLLPKEQSFSKLKSRIRDLMDVDPERVLEAHPWG